MRPVAFVSSIDYGHLGKLLQEPPLVFSLPVSNWRSQCRRCLAMLQTKKAVYPCSRQACDLIVAGARCHGVDHDMYSVRYELACIHVDLDLTCVLLELVYTDKTCKKHMAAGAGASVLTTAVLAVLSLTMSIILAVQSAF